MITLNVSHTYVDERALDYDYYVVNIHLYIWELLELWFSTYMVDQLIDIREDSNQTIKS